MLTTTTPRGPTFRRASLMSDRCPACNAPIVGTNATSAGQRADIRVMAAVDSTSFIGVHLWRKSGVLRKVFLAPLAIGTIIVTFTRPAQTHPS